MTSVRATDLHGVPLSYRVNDQTGVVSLSGRLARPGLLLYGASESPSGKPTIVYRSQAVVSDPAYLRSVKGSLISSDHSFRSINKGASGVVTNAVFADGYVAIDIMLTDPEVITEVRSGTRQLSAGYTYDYEPMSAPEILAAKAEFSGDWDAIVLRLSRPNIDRVVWIRAKNLVNNHAALVPLGRAGMACAIDEELMDEELATQGLEVPLEGALETASEEASETDMAKAATDMMLQLLDLVESLKSALKGAGIAFDTKGFAADRAGYMGTVLGNLGIQATDADLSQSIALAEAYCLGYAKAADAETVAAKDEASTGAPKVVTAVATDESKSEGSVVVSDRTRSAWDRLTGKINSKVTR